MSHLTILFPKSNQGMSFESLENLVIKPMPSKTRQFFSND